MLELVLVQSLVSVLKLGQVLVWFPGVGLALELAAAAAAEA